MKLFRILLFLTAPLIIAPNNQEINSQRQDGQQTPTYYCQKERYSEPEEKPFVSGSTRGPCGSEFAQLDLLPLAPVNHLGLTASKYPTFFWYVQLPKPRSLKFSLIEVGAVQPLYEQTFSAHSGASLMKVTIPESISPLQVGNRYQWTISVICNPTRPSANYLYSIPFKVVPPLDDILATKTEASQRAIALASAGIWYDSLYLAKISENQEIFSQLLQDVNIKLPENLSSIKD